MKKTKRDVKDQRDRWMRELQNDFSLHCGVHSKNKLHVIIPAKTIVLNSFKIGYNFRIMTFVVYCNYLGQDSHTFIGVI